MPDYTPRLNLPKPLGHESVNRESHNILVDAIDARAASIDDFVRQPGYAITAGTGNAYTVSTNPAPTAYVDGMGIVIRANRASTGASTLKWGTLATVPIVDSKGNALSIGLGSLLFLRYNSADGNFMLQGGTGAGRSATTIIAASNSSAKAKDGADYVCTGVNDHIMISSALSALSSGGKLIMHDGVYSVSGSSFVPNGVVVEGMGASTIIRVKNAANTNISVFTGIIGEDCANIVIKDLYIDGNKANHTSGTMHGISFDRLDNGRIENVTILGMRNTGIYLSGCTNCKVNKSTVTNCAFGIQLHNDSLKNSISECSCTGNTSIGIEVKFDSIGNKIKGCRLAGNNSGIYIGLASVRNIVTGNTIENNNSNGIDINATDNIISGGNIISGNGGHGLSLASGDNTVIGNIFKGNGSSGIYMNSSYNNVQSNTVRGTATYGIRINSGTGNIVTNNDLYDAGTTKFSDAGTGTITTAGNRTA